MNYKIDWQALGVMLVSGIIMVIVFSTAIVILEKTIPSEENCQNMIGLGSGYQQEYAKKQFCEYNETGWHLNRTKFIEALGRTDGWVT
jgi:hypothetical protein